jgi:hypothetical protein
MCAGGSACEAPETRRQHSKMRRLRRLNAPRDRRVASRQVGAEDRTPTLD